MHDEPLTPPMEAANNLSGPKGPPAKFAVTGDSPAYIQHGRRVQHRSNDLHKRIEFGRRKSASTGPAGGLNQQRGGRP